MIKQPYQILKWYNGSGEQDYYKLLTSKWEIQKYDTAIPPSFLIQRDARIDELSTWTLEEIDGASYDMTNVAVNPGYTDNFEIRSDSTYDYLIWTYYPVLSDLPAGRYYYIVSDGIETWYSEVFELCEHWEHIVTGSTNGGIGALRWGTHTVTNHDHMIDIVLAEVAGNGASNYSNNLSVIYKEKIQLYILEDLTAKTDNITFWLKDTSDDAVISDVYTIAEGINTYTIEPERTCTAVLQFVFDQGGTGDTYDGTLYIWAYWWYATGKTVLRWEDSINFCGLVFSEGWKNYTVLDGYPYQESTVIEETNTEDDQRNIYPLTQTVQKWYKHFIGSGVHMMEGLTMLRLMDTVTFTLTNGWEITAEDISLEMTPQDNKFHDLYNLILSYREESCSKDSCGFSVECCCPNLDNVLDTIALGALPACGAGTDGDRYLVFDGGYYISECINGTGWVRQTNEELFDNCVYNEDTDTSETYPSYWYYNEGSGFFAILADLVSVTDNADGTGTLNGNGAEQSEFSCAIYVQAQYDPGGGFVDIGDPVTLETYDSSGITVATGAGNFDFRIRLYTHNCDLMNHGDINQTIT